MAVRDIVQAAAGVGGEEATYIEDVFSTYLYTGTGAAQTITNNIALTNQTGGSGYFDGTGDWASVTSSSAFTMGTGACTIEAFVYIPVANNSYHGIVSGRSSANTGYGGLGLVLNSGYPAFTIGTTNPQTLQSASTLSINVWHHIVGVRDASGNGALFVDGVRVAFNASLTDNNTDTAMCIGRYYTQFDNYYLTGFISNVRIVKGSSVYDPTQTTLTVPTSALTNITGTSLLTMQGNTPFADNSSNGFTVTAQGNATNKLVGPFIDSDLSSYGGLVWIKSRSAAENNHFFDTDRGATKYIISNSTAAEATGTTFLTGFNPNGFSLGSSSSVNGSTQAIASWTFRKAPKFFDVVTYTGNGASGRAIAHNLGSVPGCMIVKLTSGTNPWYVYHRSTSATPQGDVGYLNNTNPFDVGSFSAYWNNTAPTDSNFTVGTDNNVNGANYVAYLFAHDAGGFGDDGTENVISCGSYTGNGSTTGPAVTLGYEPQWVMVKNVSESGYSWYITDSMRGFTLGNDAYLGANRADAEVPADLIDPTSTGFQIKSTNGNYNNSGIKYIYIAIRRGPMKTPESGTEVFAPLSEIGTGSARNVIAGFPPDTFLIKDRLGLTGAGVNGSSAFYDRLRGNSIYLQAQATSAEAGPTSGYECLFNSLQEGVNVGSNWSAYGYREYAFRRAPGFFDVIAFNTTAQEANHRIPHNLGVPPELAIFKPRSVLNQGWSIYAEPLGINQYLFGLHNDTAAASFSGIWGTSAPTATDIGADTRGSAWAWSTNVPMVGYLFATLAGVSKVGSYTGTGTTLAIDCGFSAGARFVLIKRTDSTGDWYVWDSARGIVAGNDPYLLLNSTAAEVTSTDYIDPSSAGFEISSTAPAAINASGGNFIYLAIA